MSPTYSQAEFDEAYEIGVREGYERAVQEIDMKTGGDGEYRYCTEHDPERHTPDAPAMIQRIVDRFEILNLLDDATKTGSDQPDDSTPARVPYDLRLQIGKALDRLVCDESTPEQVDKFIAVFAEFSLSICSRHTPERASNKE